MNNKLQIEKDDLIILKEILSKYPYQFYAYGSRVKGTAREYSDLDLCYFENIDGHEVEEIRDELEKSDLPFLVEVVYWNNMREYFQENIKKDLIKV